MEGEGRGGKIDGEEGKAEGGEGCKVGEACESRVGWRYWLFLVLGEEIGQRNVGTEANYYCELGQYLDLLIWLLNNI